jgi:hypothetical protein
MINPHLLIAARADALFVSPLSVTSHPSLTEVADIVRTMTRAHGGILGCAAEVAAAYGDRPELAVPRMRWALATVATLYAAAHAEGDDPS